MKIVRARRHVLHYAHRDQERLCDGLKVKNVILIVSDTLRRDHVGVYTKGGFPPGRPWKIRTPHLDRFAARSLIFENAFSCSFPTVPARNDILTGKYTFTYKPWAPLGADEITLQETLREAGHLTAAFADTPHAFAPAYNYQRGFDAWEVIRGQEADHWRTAPLDVKLPCEPDKTRNPYQLAQHLRNVSRRTRERDYYPALTMTAAADWLEENHRSPFFLYVDIFDPHEPFDPPPHYVEMYDRDYQGEEISFPRYGYADYLSKRELAHTQALYAGECSLVDTWIGYLLQRAEVLGLLENTAIFITSDHGFYFGEHGYIGKFFISHDFPASQAMPLYPELCHIPLLAYVPGVQGGRRTQELAQTVDLMPTICDLLGVRVPSTVQSHSFATVLKGKRGSRRLAFASPTISAPHIIVPNPSCRATITDGEWLLVYGSTVDKKMLERFPEVTAAVDSVQRSIRIFQREPIKPELYHFRKDPTCLKNVLASHKPRAGNLRDQFLDFLKRCKVPDAHRRFFRPI